MEKLYKNQYICIKIKELLVNFVVTKQYVVLILKCAIIATTIFSIIEDGFTFSTIIYLLPVLLFILSYFQIYRVIKHTLKAQKEIKELKITLTDNEYKDLTNGEVNTLPYDKAYCYKETKEYLYVFVDKNNALILPKREFEEEEINKITNAFNKKMRKEALHNLSSWLMVGVLILLVVLIVYNIVI